MSSTKLTPRVLMLGDCLQCGEPVSVYMQRGVPFSAYAKEQFCTTVCCRRYHGVVMASDPKVKPAHA